MTAILGDHGGMTLAEVIVALGIIAVGLVALIAAMPMSTSVVAESNLKTTATFLAQQRLEQVRGRAWTAGTPCPGTTTPAGCDRVEGGLSDGAASVAAWPDDDYGSIVIPEGEACPTAPSSTVACYPAYRRQVRITDCSVAVCSGIPVTTGGASTLRQVTVTVFFHPMAGTGRISAEESSVQLLTLIARRP